ncbi:XdhC family protein [Haloferax sp. DFSO52]|uniref:XdhC family protein n=1 Tax=Haloferax sp. DFSO52 TaxID=3388505 RepID=UPI003A89E671
MDRSPHADPWSVSETALYHSLRERFGSGEKTVLATIVDVEGSAYRRPGAKMLISADSESLGAVTAGCLEGTVIEDATHVFETAEPQLEIYDLTDDDEWGLGIGCNGIISILFEPVDKSIGAALELIGERKSATVHTVIDADDSAVSIGDRLVSGPDGTRVETETRELSDSVVAALDSSVADDSRTSRAEVSTENGSVTIYTERIDPAPRLLLFGNQNDIHPVSRVGRDVGFEVVVASARGAKSSTDEFQYAHEVVSSHPTSIADYTDELTYPVLMSHNFIDDRLALETLLTDSAVPYVGLMGPRKRFEEMQTAFANEGQEFSDEQLERIATPVGLDLGGGEPVQIALSIVSEVLAVHKDRTGGRLKEKNGPVHERAPALS